jgi:hypothetical protein
VWAARGDSGSVRNLILTTQNFNSNLTTATPINPLTGEVRECQGGQRRTGERVAVCWRGRRVDNTGGRRGTGG